MTTPAYPAPEAEAQADPEVYDPVLTEQDAWLAAHEEEAERAAQIGFGIPWADGPDRTYEQMELDDATFAAKRAHTQADPEAEAAI